MKILNIQSRGFTLVELIVSVGMAGILMVGISTFFSGTFRQLFDAQKNAEQVQGQFVINEVIRSKFINLKKLNSFASDRLIIQNDPHNGSFFSFITSKNSKIVFKDFMPFIKINSVGYYGSPTEGAIKDLSGAVKIGNIPKNFGGFTMIGSGDYYVALPLQNKIVKCVNSSCSDFNLGSLSLNHPTDIETDGTYLFISDSGNDRIVKSDTSGAVTILAEGLNFPTGLATAGGKLFIADTLNHAIKTVSTLGGVLATTLDESHGLNLPTGLNLSGNELYINDAGTGKTLKVIDPGALTGATFKFTPSAQLLGLIKVTFLGAGALPSLTATPQGGLHGGIYSVQENEFWYKFYTQLAAPLTALSGESGCIGDSTITLVDALPKTTGSDQTDQILVSSPAYPLTTNGLQDQNQSGPPYVYNLNLVNCTAHSERSNILYGNQHSGEQVFTLDLSGVTLPTYSAAKMEVFVGDLSKTPPIAPLPFLTTYTPLTKGDGILGTADDLVQTLDSSDGFKTGLALVGGFLYFSTINNDLSVNIQKFNLATSSLSTHASMAFFDTSDSNLIFDYQSDFDVGSFNFSLHNGNKILKALITDSTPWPNTKIYEINAKIQ